MNEEYLGLAGQEKSRDTDPDLISTYTRAQALEDGVLVDLTPWAKESGFKYPLAVTAAVWGYLEPPAGLEGEGQSARGRAHDLLWMLLNAIRRQPGPTDRVEFEVIFVMASGRGMASREKVRFWSVCGPGDKGEPVLTVMLEGED